eukprot:TRINITY_DN1703_c0_g1_i2.p1 TRINITY_DN1703_c0_g1~~TRINITY_DN1703_c0_g1_i2.p1  ORF type:complete len:377 (-),score=99.28 TRINITY_DN1703_c0_g1_i2:122-1252(-)
MLNVLFGLVEWWRGVSLIISLCLLQSLYLHFIFHTQIIMSDPNSDSNNRRPPPPQYIPSLPATSSLGLLQLCFMEQEQQKLRSRQGQQQLHLQQQYSNSFASFCTSTSIGDDVERSAFSQSFSRPFISMDEFWEENMSSEQPCKFVYQSSDLEEPLADKGLLKPSVQNEMLSVLKQCFDEHQNQMRQHPEQGQHISIEIGEGESLTEEDDEREEDEEDVEDEDDDQEKETGFHKSLREKLLGDNVRLESFCQLVETSFAPIMDACENCEDDTNDANHLREEQPAVVAEDNTGVDGSQNSDFTNSVTTEPPLDDLGSKHRIEAERSKENSGPEQVEEKEEDIPDLVVCSDNEDPVEQSYFVVEEDRESCDEESWVVV